MLCAVCLGVFRASAVALDFGDSSDLGLISKNHPANPSSSAGFIDILLARPLGSGPVAIGANFYTRTGNDPLSGSYPSAVYSGVEYGGGVTRVDLGTGGFDYLLAKYDGPNYGSVVWYVGDLTGTVTIPLDVAGQYGVSHTFLYTVGVPDGGATVAMLGLAFLGMIAARGHIANMKTST